MSSRTLSLIALICLVSSSLLGQENQIIDLSGFRDGIKHWRDEPGRGRNDARYDSSEVGGIADNLVSYQNEDGGWPKNIDWLMKTDPQTIRALFRPRSLRSTFDNRNTYTQIVYLAKAYGRTGDPSHRRSAERGVDYILSEQRRTGGWRGWDVDAITYNDDVMLGVMRLLRAIRDDAPHFTWLDEGRRIRAKAALVKAVDVTLRCQIVVDGVKTAWCQQHDHETLAPVQARTYELPAICPAESVGIVRFLMEIKDPQQEVVDAVEAAVAWFEESKIEGIRVVRVTLEPTTFKSHVSTHDRVVVPDPDAAPIWARYYEIGTNRPFFCNRDGIKVYRLAEVKLERRTGYGWYTGSPNSVLDYEFFVWKARIAREE